LYAQAERIGKENGCPEAILDIFFDNPVSMASHKALGYEPFVLIYKKKVV
jgi:hypothetical protein